MAKTNVSRLTQIYRAEKTKGRGLGSAIGKATLEKIDPRQFFNQQGLLAAIFPTLFKAYKAPIQSEVSKTSPTALQAPTQSEVSKTSPTALQFSTLSLENKIDDLSTHAKISAKNSLVLPSMARDMNLTRQNIARLVKLQGGKPSYKSDMFFMRAAEREATYESQFKKERPVMAAGGTKPTATKTEESGPSFFDKLLKGLAIGGLIGGLIYGAFKMLKDKVQKFYDDTVKQIEDIYTDIKKVVMDKFNQVKEKISNIMDEITVDNLKQAAQNFFNGLLNAIKNLPTGFGGTPGAITSGGESPENPNIVPATSSIGLGAAQDEAERAKKMGPKGEKVETVKGVVGYYQTVGQGRGTQGKKFVPLQGESLVNYYEKEIKRVEDLLGGETLSSAQLSAQSFANTEAGKVAIERYLKQKGSPTPAPTQTSTLPTPTAAEFQKSDKDVTPTAKPGQYGQEKRFPSMPDATVKDAISVAAKKTGVPEALLLAIARQESGFDPNAKAKSSSATGLYQFIDDTWRRYLLKYSKDYPELTSGRTDPYANALAGALYAKESISYLKEKNISPTAENIYAVHFLGPEGSRKLLTASDDTTVNNVISEEQLKANPAVFGNEQKGYKTVAQVKDFFFNKIGKLTAEYETALNAGSSSVQMAAASITPVAATPTIPSVTQAATIPAITPVAAAPTIPSNIQTTIKSDGTKLGTATIEVAQARVQIGSAPIVVAPPTVNVQAPQIQGGTGGFGAMVSSSVVDTEFMKLLVGRTVTL